MSRKSVPCAKCKKNITPIQNPGLSCCNCHKNFHYQCAGLDKVKFTHIVTDKSQWACQCSSKRRSTIFAQLPLQPDNSGEVDSTGNNTLTPPAAPAPSEIAERSVQDRIKDLESLLTPALLKIDRLESQIKEQSELITSLRKEVEGIESTTSSIERSLVDDNLEIRELPAEALEDATATVIAIGTQIGCPLNDTDFSINPARDSKIIRVTFSSKIKRRNFLLAGKSFNRAKKRFLSGNSHHRIHVNEELTGHQRRLYHAAKAFRREHNFKFSWFDLNGQLWLKKCEGSIPHLIRGLSDLSTSNVNLLPELQGAPYQESRMSAGSSRQQF